MPVWQNQSPRPKRTFQVHDHDAKSADTAQRIVDAYIAVKDPFVVAGMLQKRIAVVVHDSQIPSAPTFNKLWGEIARSEGWSKQFEKLSDLVRAADIALFVVEQRFVDAHRARLSGRPLDEATVNLGGTHYPCFHRAALDAARLFAINDSDLTVDTVIWLTADPVSDGLSIERFQPSINCPERARTLAGFEHLDPFGPVIPQLELEATQALSMLLDGADLQHARWALTGQESRHYKYECDHLPRPQIENGLQIKPAEENGSPELPENEVVTVEQMAHLVQKKEKTIRNNKITAELEPVGRGPWRYSDVRQRLLKKWPAMAYRLPESYSDAMKLLPP